MPLECGRYGEARGADAYVPSFHSVLDTNLAECTGSTFPPRVHGIWHQRVVYERRIRPHKPRNPSLMLSVVVLDSDGIFALPTEPTRPSSTIRQQPLAQLLESDIRTAEDVWQRSSLLSALDTSLDRSVPSRCTRPILTKRVNTATLPCSGDITAPFLTSPSPSFARILVSALVHESDVQVRYPAFPPFFWANDRRRL